MSCRRSNPSQRCLQMFQGKHPCAHLVLWVPDPGLAGSVLHSTNLDVWKNSSSLQIHHFSFFLPSPFPLYLSIWSFPSLKFIYFIMSSNLTKTSFWGLTSHMPLTYRKLATVVPENGGEKCTLISIMWDNLCSYNRRYISQTWLQFSQHEFPASFMVILALKDMYLSYKIIASKWRPTTDSTQLEGKYSCDGHTERGEVSAQGG